MHVISHKIHQFMLLGSLPACMVAMVLFHDPSSDQPTHDMPGGRQPFHQPQSCDQHAVAGDRTRQPLYGTAYPEIRCQISDVFSDITTGVSSAQDVCPCAGFIDFS